MINRTVWVAGLLVVLSSCGSEQTNCGDKQCSDAEFCDRQTLRCVTDERPVVTLSPPGGVVKEASFIVTGTAVDDVAVTSIEWQAGSAEWTAVDLATDGTFSLVVTTPALDAQAFVISVRARDAKGETLVTGQAIVDTVAPAVTRSAPAETDVVNAATVSVGVSATDGSGALSSLTIGGQSVASPGNGVAASVMVPVPPSLNRATFNVPVVAKDPSDNTRMLDVAVLVDNVAPVVTLTADAGTAITTAVFQATATAIDPSPVTVTFKLGNAPEVTATEAGGVFVAPLDIPMVEGSEALVVTATDALGNSATANRAVNIDRLPPTVTVTSPLANSVHRSAISVSVTTQGQTSSVTASLGASPVTLTGAGSTWTGSVPVPAGDFTARTLTVTAVDSGGNQVVSTVAVNTDTVAPVIAFTAPTAGRKFKVSDFASGNDVAVTWTVTDGDTNAATTHFDGAAFSGTTRNVVTSPTDNPTSYTRAVNAADRAGNTATASIMFSVDRVAPTIVSWTPAAGTRNLVGASTVITFSEAVNGVGANDAPFGITGQPTPGGVWNTGHTQFTMSLASFNYDALEFTTSAAFVDGHGNAIPVQTHRLHTATSVTGGVIATGVTSFDAESDLDGVLSVVTTTITCVQPCIGGGPVRLYRDDGSGALAQVGGTLYANGFSSSLNVWNSVDSTTLVSTPRYGVRSLGFGEVRRAWSGGSDTLTGVSATGLPVARTALYGEAYPDFFSAPTLGFGFVSGTTYARSPLSASFDFSPNEDVVPSHENLSFLGSDGTALRIGRYWCGRPVCGAPACLPSFDCTDVTVTVVGTPNSNAQQTSASTASGSCLGVSFDENSNRRYALLPRLAAETATWLTTPSPFTISSAIGGAPYTRSIRFGRYTWGSEDVLLYTDFNPDPVTGGLTVRKLTGCNAPSGVDPVVGNIGITAQITANAMPVQVGNKIGVVWLKANGELRLSVFP